MNAYIQQRTWQDGNGTTFSRSASSDGVFQELTLEQEMEIKRHFQVNPPKNGYRKYTVTLPRDKTLSRDKVFSCNIRVVNTALGQRECKLNKAQVG
ncbi:MAG: hypothetical protein LBF42_04360 [Puniceicoccales bacterium]|jgi:hypothetical protein|nr:hypothetical protein [Puniceicoccales bacterium]